MLVDQPNHTLLNTLKIPSQYTVTFTWWLIPTRSMINRWVLLQVIHINRRFNQKKKKEVRLHYSDSGNFAEAAKPFGINESTMRGMIKAPPVPDIVKLSSKCNFPGAGWPLNYPLELDDELLTWILLLHDLYFSVSVLSFQERAKLVIKPHNPSFFASHDWVDTFLAWHKLGRQARTSIS